MADVMIAEPSVKSLLLRMRFGEQPLSSGTGFICESPRGPLLITNRHNVTGRHQQTGQAISPTGGVPDNLVILHNRENKLGEWVERVEPLYQDEKPLWHEHPKMGPDADFVALPLTRTDDIQLYPYDLGNVEPDIAVGPADVVSVVGFPFGLTGGGALGIWATGFVASETTLPDQPTFLIDCRSRQGQSGSAVIAYRSGGMVNMADGNAGIFGGPVTKFLGIYSGRINAESDLGIVWKSRAVQEMIESIGR